MQVSHKFLLLCTALLIAAVTGQDRVDIIVTPQNATVVEGEDFLIECNRIGGTAMLPNLAINGEVADPSNIPMLSVGQIEGTENITYSYSSVTPDDNGTTFQCSTESVMSDMVTLSVLFSPSLMTSESQVGVLEGNSVNVMFTVNANPAITNGDVTVTLPDGATANPVVTVEGSTITLAFSNVMRADDGIYTVEVNNTQGGDNAMFTLNVYYGPTFVDMDSTVIVLAGESVMLDCSVAESKPNATVTYTTNASSTAGVEFTSDIIRIATSTVANTGTYTCTANSTENVASLMFVLCVGNLPSSAVTITATYDANNVLTVTFMMTSSDNTVTRYELFLIDSNGVRTSLQNYITGLEDTVIESYTFTTSPYTVELMAFNKFGLAIVGMADASEEPTMATTTDGSGAGATIATSALLLVMMIMALML